MHNQIYFPYLASPVWLVGGAVLVIALVILLYLRARPIIPVNRRNALMTLRLFVVAIVLLCIANPIIRVFKTTKFQSLVAILLDTSRSMNIEDEKDGMKRIERAKRNLVNPEFDLVEQLGKRFRLRLFKCDADIKQVGSFDKVTADGDRTNINQSLSSLLALLTHETVAGVVMFSDGADNGRGNLSQTAAAFRQNGIPVYTVCTGGVRPIKDIEIGRVSVHREVLLNTIVSLKAEIVSSGFDGLKLPLVLRRGSERAGGEIIAKKQVQLTGGSQQVTMEFAPEEEGLLDFELSLPPQQGEMDAENNRINFFVSSEKHKLRVLYMEGTQYRKPERDKWEFQYLVEALEEDPAIEVTTLMRDDFEAARKVGLKCVREGFPKTKRELYEYDVVISSDIDIVYFTEEQLKNLVDFVAVHGGGFIMIGGYTAFGPGGYDESIIDKMLPVDMEAGRDDRYTEGEKFRWKITEQGWTHPIMQIDPDPKKNREIWESMPEFNGFNHVLRAKPHATVLAVHPFRKTIYGPCVQLAVQQYGKGRTMAFATDTTAGWGEEFEEKWGTGDDNEYFRKFWQNAVRWVGAYQLKVPNSPVIAATDAVRYLPGDRVEISASVVDENYEPALGTTVTAQITLPDGTSITRPLEPDISRAGRYFVRYVVGQQGDYSATVSATLRGSELGSDTVKFSCRAADVERRNYRPNPDLLDYLSDRTGGKRYTFENLPKLLDDLKSTISEEQNYVERCFWDNKYLYILLLSLLCVEWFTRRRFGMP